MDVNGDGKITLEEFTSTIAEHYQQGQTSDHTSGQTGGQTEQTDTRMEPSGKVNDVREQETVAAKEEGPARAKKEPAKATDLIAEARHVGSPESKPTVEQTDDGTENLSPKGSNTAAAAAVAAAKDQAKAEAPPPSPGPGAGGGTGEDGGAGAGAGAGEARKTLRQRKVEDNERRERELKVQADREAAGGGGAWSDVEEAPQPLGTNLDGPDDSVANANGAPESPASARERLASLSSVSQWR